jgi:hypothetical protein
MEASWMRTCGREDRDDAVDGLRRVERVQGAHHQVAGLGRRDGRLDRLEVAHLAHEDHVRVLAERGAECVGEALGVDADLALVDDRATIADQELDGILDRHDVTGPVAVDVVDHRGERRRLAGAGRAGDEHQAALLHGDRLDHLGQHELLDALDAEGDDAKDDADRPPLLEHVDPEASEAGDAVGEVDFAGLLEAPLLHRVHDAEGHLLDLLGRHALAVLQRDERAVDPEHRGQPGLEMDVRGGPVESDLQDLVQLHLASPRPAAVSPKALRPDEAAP